jgi:hypothetical protein
MTGHRSEKQGRVHLPNFFILGAGKSGTTSLYFYLKQHPEIFLSPEKEPSFFCEQFQVVKNPTDYFRLFDAVRDEKIIGEASHVYLSNPPTARVLAGLFPKAKFVVIFRNPADRAYSLYHHMRRLGYETIGTFEKALQEEERRVNSARFRRNCPQYFYNFLYFRSGLYGEQIERYLSLFSKDQFHFLTLDELKHDPMGALGAIWKFLGVSPDFRPQLEVMNRGLTARVLWLQYFWRTKVKYPQRLRNRGLRFLDQVNLKPIPPIQQETRKDLMFRYEDDLKKLYNLTGVRVQR